MYHGVDQKKRTNPKEKANLFSLITFFFTHDLLKKGYKNDFVEEDVYEVLHKFRSSKLGDTLEEQWAKEQKRKNPSVYRLLWACYGKYYLFLGFIQLGMKICVLAIQPNALGKFVSYFTSSTKLTRADAIYYACVLIAINIINTTYGHNYMFHIMELGVRIKTAFCSLIYRKSLKLTSSSLSATSVGKIVTLVTKDVTNFENAIIFMNDMWISLILLVLTSWMMYKKIGVAALAGVLFLVLIIPLQVLFGKLTTTLRLKASKVTDQRIQLTQEILSAIKTIKMYTWERFFGEKISKAREKEVTKVKQIFFSKATSLVIGGLVISVTFYIIVITYIQMGNYFTAEVAVFLNGCLHILRSSVTISIPIGIAQTAELIASVNRIRKFLTADEQPQTSTESDSKPIIELKQVAVEVNKIPILHNVNLTFKSGLNFITGKLGGGKSSLLKTILRDYPTCAGSLTIHGTVSYASEEPWLFPSSIRQNILFGQKYNPERYNKVLQVCALEQDFDTFEKGDSTIVDDRGMNLSKGQQARISLARAVYCDSDIYLLDDCLSSLDTQVQEYVFRECVKTFLKDKIVVMISHNERQIKDGDCVVIMEGGTVKSCLKPSEIRDEEIEELVREDDKGVEDDIIDNIVLENDESREDTKLIDKPKHNIYSEQKKEGKVDFGVYRKYFTHGGSLFVLFLIILLFVSAQSASIFSENCVKNWINLQQNISDYKFNASNISETEYHTLIRKNTKVINMYTAAIITSTVLLLLRAFALFAFATRASVALHKAMALSVVNATMKFFDLHYIGNILNRFSKDLAMIDEILPHTLYECFRMICFISGVLILILIVRALFIIPICIMAALLFILRKYYLPTGRSLKRLESATRSPFIGHLNASLEGLTIIRAYRTEDILREEFDKHQDLYTSTFYMMQCTARAFAYFADMICSLFMAIIITWLLITRSDSLPGNVTLAITQALGLTGLLQWAIRQWAELENYMTSVERVLEYANVETENRAGQVLDDWPTGGKITYQRVNLTYGKSKEFVLKDITFAINPREKIGIVGRTGAGKSSLISTLFRLYRCEGAIAIDDVDIKTLSLDFLRSNIAIIPQDPVLFSGTIRSNIDPIGLHTDEEIWKAVTTANLKTLVTSLDYEITESGSNYSSGQRQLICLARAIISKCKIIILDEATANVDPETDVMIYSIIQENFASCTVLTIAHRLHTVMYSDRVMVVDKGEIVEFDSPSVLLSNQDGFFYKMIQQANLLK
ncbi:ATP-binding cassette subfamily C member 4 [Tribolium castaneum]|uniref:Putative multidrug resistance-associated protein lethal(2)03659-like Protein n=1 Tax=Tribolium castaneum TaxID=7070 RepID=D6WLN0_TRICA|nr:PREDICTED: multidrug resistance-associated protein 4 [Tribolium castaneum]XP_015835853.1 PREDICTED: multidrug resistance-associated protein 4 [Tribolium castaneum]XP_015835854.1 PREDICTED: multidrug resistance-associated protein 4 [Tribolium castaneum]XP_971632.1 PREDICTED: multidrug resistance-associated protein 4 [Tribolium castaneum]EFA04135.1 putative multidrug resistance-associated protein lethal(2)03659-like Protein [Tribolium castaneum]|eukprot:XP_015835852.1 PREDICTED: multidrug resistance-associated protein 4 [Tribolium castaneum]